MRLAPRRLLFPHAESQNLMKEIDEITKAVGSVRSETICYLLLQILTGKIIQRWQIALRSKVESMNKCLACVHRSHDNKSCIRESFVRPPL